MKKFYNVARSFRYEFEQAFTFEFHRLRRQLFRRLGLIKPWEPPEAPDDII